MWWLKKKLYQPKNLFSAFSDVGAVRMQNEDYAYANTNRLLHHMLAVADGLGNNEGSEIASEILVKTFAESFLTCHYLQADKEQWFVQTINQAKKRMQKHVQGFKHHKDMATTLVLALIENQTANLFWIGDSRAYLINKRKAEQITKDHNFLNYLIDQKKSKTEILNYKEHWLALTHCVNLDMVKPQVYNHLKLKMKHEQILFLASDGFYNFFKLEEIFSQVWNNQDLNKVNAKLNETAIHNQSNDNLSFAYLVY